jgi:ATP-dependent Clp protease ATP-binding subunit ClpB
MTSNVGSQYILDTDDDLPKEVAYETIKRRVMDAARSVFRPEFMNRVDEYIVFQPLDRDQINSIVRLQVCWDSLFGLIIFFFSESPCNVL